jgi:TRAP-type C4-dicarboxylate transport system permease small subunit
MSLRKLLDGLYDAAAWAAAFFMVGILFMVGASVAGREFGFYLRGSDAYAGYCMAAASFLALAQTLRRGEHIRVQVLLDHTPASIHRALEVLCHLIGTVFAGALAFFSARLVWTSYTLNDISQGTDATPLWIPQLAMAIGCAVFLVAILDGLMQALRGREPEPAPALTRHE